MKKMLLLLFCAISSMFTYANGGGTMYDLNFRVIQNDNIIGGVFKVAVEIKGADGLLRIGGIDGTQKGGALFTLAHTMSSLQFVSGSIDPNFSNLTNQAVTYNAVKGHISLRARSTSDLEFYDIPTSWTQFATLTFSIVSFNSKLGFKFASSRISDLTSSNVQYPSNIVQDEIRFNGSSFIGGNGMSGAPATDGSDICKPLILDDGTAVLTAAIPSEFRVDYFEILDTNKLIVAENASLYPWSRNSGDYLIVNRFYGSATLAVGASNTGYGQYKGPALPITFEQYWGASIGWRNMAFPITGISELDLGGPGANINLTGGTSAICTPTNTGAWGNYVNTTNLYEFTAGTAQPCNTVNEHEYVGLTSTPVGGANGYYVFIGPPFFTTNGLVSVKGTSVDATTYNYTQSTPHATGTGSQALMGPAVQAAWDGWRLISNPFTCAMDVSAWATDNGVGAASIKIFDRGSNSLITAPSTIAPGQSFWFKNASNASLTFDIYDHGTTSSIPVLTKSAGASLEIVVASPTSKGFATINFNESATVLFDENMDSYYRHEFFIESPTIAMGVKNVQGSMEFVDVNSIGLNSEDASFPLYINGLKDREIEISINAGSGLSGNSVHLEDLELAPGKLFNLEHGSYKTHNSSWVNNGRFLMHVNASKARLDNTEEAYAWFVNGELMLYGFEEGSISSIQIFNVAGQLVNQAIGNETMYIEGTGMFLVYIENLDGTTKVVKALKK